MDSSGEDPFAPASLREYRARHSRSDRRGLNSHDQQGITSQYPAVGNSLQPQYINRQSPRMPRQLTDQSRRVTTRPIYNEGQGRPIYNEGQGNEEAQTASPKPIEPKRSRRSKTIKYKTNGDGGEDEEKENRERKVSKYKKRLAEGKGPEKGSLGPKGEVRIRGGEMEFRDVNNPEWTLAAYHYEYRRQFIDEAAEFGNFDQEPTRGEADDDETSFEPEQQSWGPSRDDDWHNIVNSRGEKVMFLVDKPADRRPPQEPGNWIHDGYVLLDSNNHPVKNWLGLNKTLSTEIEAWRWEAIVRVYPWLTVADLMARMPPTRKKKGKVLPLQKSQAFTNRTLRLRTPYQMPTIRPKNGSAAYKESILKNLAERNAKTTENLPVLKKNQIAKARKANEGKFDENSRYVVKKKEVSTEMPPPLSRKRKAKHDNDTEPEVPLEAPVVKRQRTRAPYKRGVATSGPNDLTSTSLSDDVNADAYWEGANVYNAPPNSATVVNDQSQQLGPTRSTSQYQDHYENGLVLLFSTIVDRQHALAMDRTFTSPVAVKRAWEQGWQIENFINVDWYTPDTPRFVNPDGSIVESVVHPECFDRIASLGGINDAQGTVQDSGSYNATSSFAQDAGTFTDDNQINLHGDGVYNATPSLHDGTFDNDQQGIFHGDGVHNATPSIPQDAGGFNDDIQDTFHGDGAYSAMSSFAQHDPAFNDDSQGTSQGNGAYNATQSYGQDDGTFDATSTFPQGDLPSDFNTFYSQNDFGGNPNPHGQIPANPLPALPTQPEARGSVPAFVLSESPGSAFFAQGDFHRAIYIERYASTKDVPTSLCILQYPRHPPQWFGSWEASRMRLRRFKRRTRTRKRRAERRRRCCCWTSCACPTSSTSEGLGLGRRRLGNAGRHMQNAAGWAFGLRKDGQDGEVTREAQPAWEGGEGEQLPLLDSWHSSIQV
ncbi:hypothetical protein BDR22DRAFT_959851 [Usnea florida]